MIRKILWRTLVAFSISRFGRKIFNMKVLLATALLSAALLAHATDTKTIQLLDSKGAVVGSATLTSAGKGVDIHLRVQDLAPGEHAVHIHQTASCQAPDFKSAGPHFNPTNKKHGLKNKQEGHHAGDMQNFTVPASGRKSVTLHNNDVTLDQLTANGGTALVIHAKADDMMTDPSGNSGDRIACGEIK
jgi:superoxide dismutase, Cu-Zn family